MLVGSTLSTASTDASSIIIMEGSTQQTLPSPLLCHHRSGWHAGKNMNILIVADIALTWQVVRMLSLAPADVQVVSRLQAMHPQAKADNFGHMFRSPTMWEDMVKSITLCNCG